LSAGEGAGLRTRCERLRRRRPDVPRGSRQSSYGTGRSAERSAIRAPPRPAATLLFVRSQCPTGLINLPGPRPPLIVPIESLGATGLFFLPRGRGWTAARWRSSPRSAKGTPRRTISITLFIYLTGSARLTHRLLRAQWTAPTASVGALFRFRDANVGNHWPEVTRVARSTKTPGNFIDFESPPLRILLFYIPSSPFALLPLIYQLFQINYLIFDFAIFKVPRELT
jgi:hypothetical protein